MGRVRTCASAWALLGGLTFLFPCPAAGDWPVSPSDYLPLCEAVGTQSNPVIASYGAGGVIVAWEDARGGLYDIYAQRASREGDVLWTTDGVSLCAAAGDQMRPAIVKDGAGGAIVLWHDGRSGNSDVYAQRVTSNGTVAWAVDGVPICTAAGDQWYPVAVADGAGGAVITWYDSRGGDDYNHHIYAQRVSAEGVAQWPADGVALCAARGDRYFPVIATDGSGGAIVAWYDSRDGDYDVYAQRISGDGTVMWEAEGVALCTAPGDQLIPDITSDGAGGAIVAWQDNRVGDYNYDVYAQRVSADGAPQWVADGVALCTAPGEQLLPTMATDGANGAIVGWQDGRSGRYDIYAQRVSATGSRLWPNNGKALCVAAYDQWRPAVVADGAGGAIACWLDERTSPMLVDIYAQRVSAAGGALWPVDGSYICHGVRQPLSINADGTGGAIIAWATSDICATRVRGDGLVGGTVDVQDDAPMAFGLDPLWPNPTRGTTLTVRYSLARPGAASLELLDIAGRRISVYDVGPSAVGPGTVDLGAGNHLLPGVYFVRLRQGGQSCARQVTVLR